MCNKEKFWPVLCHKIERPEWADRDEFKDFAHRLASRSILTEELESVLTTKTTEEWLTIFSGEVPAAPVYNIQQALDNPFVQEQQRILELQGSAHPMRTVASPVRAGPHPAGCAPGMGEHNQAILESVGYTTKEIESLIARAII
jgi:crotonobetainyl-CoA:carnitine CoA-transferase CaiB-like acyl-CoA transferase